MDSLINLLMKGQAAIEYLMTYGWAIFALAIVIGILLFSGILTPNYLISEECNLGSNIICPSEQFAIENKGDATDLKVTIQNGFPYKIKINELAVYSMQDKDVKFVLGGATLESGDSHVFSGKIKKGLTPNSVQRLFINLTYASCAPEVASPGKDCSDSNHTIVGRITGRVIAE